MNHVHSWRRFRGNKFVCCGTTCYTKMDLEFLEGKLAECPKCRKHFIIMVQDVLEEQPTLTCPDCELGCYELTVEGRTGLLGELAQEVFQEQFEIREKNLVRKESELITRESDLRQFQRNLAQAQINDEKAKEKFLRDLKQKQDQLLTQQHKLKLTRDELAIKFRERRKELYVQRIRLKEELKELKEKKQKVEVTVEKPPEHLLTSISLTLDKAFKKEIGE